MLGGLMVGVLATQDGGRPHASLVGFAVTDDLKALVFATPRYTRKYDYLKAEPAVALLVDDRSNEEGDFHNARAVTAYGSAREAEGGDVACFRELYLSRHPYMADFANAPGTALIVIDVDKYSLVTRFQNVEEIEP